MQDELMRTRTPQTKRPAVEPDHRGAAWRSALAALASAWRSRLQRHTTTLAAQMEDTVRVCLHLPSATGSGAALCRRLRASSRRYHRPTGPIQQPGQTQDWIKLGGKDLGAKVRSDRPGPLKKSIAKLNRAGG